MFRPHRLGFTRFGFSYVGFCQDALWSHGWGCELGSRPPRGAQALTQPEWSGVAGGAVRVG
ncbi:MAG TPA: hypothetical protein VGI40_01570, partial [Pirellulaceae bacterium]